MSQSGATRHWLLLIYRVPQDPASRRTYVWRQLKQLGAIYLQQAAAILPDQPDLRTALEALAGRIREFGGEVSLLETTSPSPEWEQDLISRFNKARDEEYAEVVKNVERFEDEVRRESQRGRYSFAELEDIEGDFERVQRWHERVRARDFFGAPARSGAAEAVKRGRATRDAFAAQVADHEGIPSGTRGGGPAAVEQS